jgi:serine/threonine-protein kinase
LIGKYRVVRDLGMVGMARVSLAALEGPDGFSKVYVIKRISPAHVPNPRLAGMLANEASVAAALDHPNIVRLLEFFQEDDDSYFLVLEHVDGASLDQLLRVARTTGAPLGPDFAAEIGLQLARALAHVHGWGLLHGEVSPGNVLISREGAVKLTNVGVANSSIATQRASGANATLSYASPEQLKGMITDHRSDLFSLGMMLLEVATGVHAAGGDSSGVMEPVVMSEVASFPAILTKLLRRDPSARYQNAAELVADLEALWASRPVNVRRVSLADTVKACLAAADAPAPRAPSAPIGVTPVSIPTAAPAVAAVPAAAPVDEVPLRLVVVVSLVCLVCSLLFWFTVL